MMVLFTSLSEKKSISTVRRILDSFADRIGDNTWKTVITADGLEAVHTLLRKSATKSTVVSCHWIRSRSRSELVWVVGNRDAFNEAGAVPVNQTSKNINRLDWENNWHYMPLLKALVAVAALFHDLGKASDHFQKKLAQKSLKADPYRHEWISCKIVEALVNSTDSVNDDMKWLMALKEGRVDFFELRNYIDKNVVDFKAKSLKPTFDYWMQLPPLAQAVCHLILGHHRLPVFGGKSSGKNEWEQKEDKQDWKRYSGEKKSVADLWKSINARWGYRNDNSDIEKDNVDVVSCFTFSKGLIGVNTPLWAKSVKKWSARLYACFVYNPDIFVRQEDHSGDFRSLMTYSRLCLVLADHYVSSTVSDGTKFKAEKNTLWANTRNGKMNQGLEEHLVRVCEQAVRIAHNLPRLSENMEAVQDNKALSKKSPKAYKWQDMAVDKIKLFRKQSEHDNAFFVINAASTGCGKTYANAKIMQALSKKGNSLRYILALGLRSLTLQTGDEYKERIKLNESELAVLIGSSAISKLHDEEKNEYEPALVDEPESLLTEEVWYKDTEDGEQIQFLNIFFDTQTSRMLSKKQAQKNHALMYKPVLVATIDHIMGATESIRGGKFILPSLRLMSSDLVIDEIDDFSQKDLIAICRLVHLAGLFGRNVTISSATIPPDLAEVLYRSYAAGLDCFSSFYGSIKRLVVIHCDEFGCQVMPAARKGDFKPCHERFIQKRVKNLGQQPVKRRGIIQEINRAKNISQEDLSTMEEQYFACMKDAAEQLHYAQHVTDKKTGKQVSFGIIRVAHIDACVRLCKYLLDCLWSKDISVRLMAYHSRQILLLRHEQEKYLDSVLKRKEQQERIVDFVEPIVRSHIDNCSTDNILFIVVATPVEEVGRDHDADWAVIEPSSYRSIIQLAGRVRRHRNRDNVEPNIAVMQFNLAGLRKQKVAFTHPGYETSVLTVEHDLKKCLNEQQLRERIDAVPRINKPKKLCPHDKLIDLEHCVMEELNRLDNAGPEVINGWINEGWWLTGMPQYINRFRESSDKDVKLFAVFEDGRIRFKEYSGINGVVDKTEIYNISQDAALSPLAENRLWISRDYEAALRERSEVGEDEEEKLLAVAKLYGEIVLPDKNQSSKNEWLYSDQFGLFKKKGGEEEL
jgi:CRISPR-associated endonuclease/helicase Cas3